MATSSLGRLTLDLAVRLSEFTDGMSRAERETQNRTRNMQASVTAFREHLANELSGTEVGEVFQSLHERFGSLEGNITKVGGALAGMAVGYAVGNLAKMAVEAAKADAELAVMANRANTSVQNFQTLAVAAEGLGISQENLGDMLADVQEKLGEFSATEGGEASDFFNALKDNTKMTDDQIRAFGKTLQGKDGIEAIQLIKNKLDAMGASAQEQRFILESLGNDVGNMGVIFNDGGKILKQYRDALEEAGVIKTKEAIEQSQLLAAQTQSLHQRYDGFKSQLAGQMIPILGSLAQYFFGSGQKASAFGGVIQGVGIVAKGVAAVILTFSVAIGMFGSTVGQVLAQLANVGGTALDVFNADGIEAKMKALSQGLANSKTMGANWWEDMVAQAKRADTAMANIVNGQTLATDKLTQANLALYQSQLDKNKGLGKTTKQAKDEEKALKDLAKEKEKAAKKEKDAVIFGSEQSAWNKVISNAQKYNFAGLEKQNGIPAGLMSAIHMQESHGNTSARSWSSNGKWGYARGGFQMIKDTWGRFGSGDFMSNVNDMTKAAPAAAKYLSFLYKKFNGDVQKVIAAYNTGEGNVEKYGMAKIMTNGYATMKNGKGQTFDYVKNVSRFRAAYNGGKVQETSTKDFLESQSDAEAKAQKDAEHQAEELARLRQSVTQNYASQEEKIELDHTAKLTEINKAYIKDSIEWKRYMAAEEKRYQDAKFDYSIDKALQYAEGEEKITLEHQKQVKKIERDFANDDTNRELHLKKEEESYQKDLANFKWAAGEKARAQKAIIDKIKEEMAESTNQSVSAYTDSRMKATMSPQQYEQWKLQQSYRTEHSSVMNKYASRDSEINKKDDAGNYVINDDQERYALQLQAKEEFNAQMLLLDQSYAEQKKALDEQLHSEQEQRAGDAFATQTGFFKDFLGEQSGLYRMAFAMEKAYAVQKAVMNAEETYTNTYNAISAIPLVGPYLAAPMAAIAVGAQLARAANIRGMQAPSGIAHGGLDYVPKETTFLLDKGERVVSPRQNKDLTRYLNERQKANTPNVVVNNNSSAQVTAEHTPDGGVNIQMVERMIKRSFGRIGEANSFESRQIQQHTTARYNRK